MHVRIIATGGTFDKHYDEISGALDFSAGSYLPAMLTRARVSIPYTLEELPLLDSRDMQDIDRRRILAACSHAVDTHIVIVHGTDTMTDTAAVLGSTNPNKVIVLTGAMIPYSIRDSDALFNLGFALGAVQSLPNGVYIAMNCQTFEWDKVRKNRVAGCFETIQ
jgi:L-asparaginase